MSEESTKSFLHGLVDLMMKLDELPIKKNPLHLIPHYYKGELPGSNEYSHQYCHLPASWDLESVSIIPATSGPMKNISEGYHVIINKTEGEPSVCARYLADLKEAMEVQVEADYLARHGSDKVKTLYTRGDGVSHW